MAQSQIIFCLVLVSIGLTGAQDGIDCGGKPFYCPSCEFMQTCILSSNGNYVTQGSQQSCGGAFCNADDPFECYSFECRSKTTTTSKPTTTTATTTTPKPTTATTKPTTTTATTTTPKPTTTTATTTTPKPTTTTLKPTTTTVTTTTPKPTTTTLKPTTTTVTTTTPRPTTVTITTPKPIPTTPKPTSTTPVPTTKLSTTTTPTTTTTPKPFVCTSEGRFPYAPSCLKYYMCVPKATGGFNQYLYTCPMGKFSPIQKVCTTSPVSGC